MIATSLIFLMIQRAIVLPLAVYMCITIVWQRDNMINANKPEEKEQIKAVRILFWDNIMVCIFGMVEIVFTAVFFVVNTICCPPDDDDTLYQLTNNQMYTGAQNLS